MVQNTLESVRGDYIKELCDDNQWLIEQAKKLEFESPSPENVTMQNKITQYLANNRSWLRKLIEEDIF